MKKNQPIDHQLLEDYADFFLHFVDECTQVKEEILFKDLLHGDIHPTDYMLDNLVHEHELGKKLATELKNMIATHEVHDHNAKEKLIHLLHSLQHLYVNHLAKEEEYVLPNIHAILDEGELEYLQQSFKKIDEQLEKKYLSYLQFAENINLIHG